MISIKKIQNTYYLLISLFWLAVAIPMALGVLLIRARGINLLEIGVLMGVYSLTIVVLEVPTGGLADAIGRKKVALAAYICGGVASVVYLFAFTFPVMILGFILSGVGRALSSGALDAWFVDALQDVDPDVDLQPFLSKAGIYTYLALGLGALGGSLLPRLSAGLPTGLPADGTAILTPLSVPIALSVLVQVVLVILTGILVKEERTQIEGGNWREGFRKVPELIGSSFELSRKNPTIILLLGTLLAGGFAVIGLESFWQPHFAELLGNAVENSFIFGVIMGGNFIVGMVGNMIATPLSRLLNKRYALVGAIFQGLWGGGILLLAMQTNTNVSILLFWLVYLNMGVINSPQSTLLNNEIPAEQRSSMLSIASLVTYVGAMLGGAGLGYVAENFSIRSAWMIGGAVLVVSLFLYWRIDIRQRQTTAKFEEVLSEA